jgi:hypothetical protein
MRNGGFRNAGNALAADLEPGSLISRTIAYSSTRCEPKTSQNLPLLR